MKNLKILWIDDSQEWYKSQKESLEIDLQSEGITVEFEYQKDANRLTDAVLKKPRFELFDIIFVDFSLSNGSVGDEIIKKMRDNDINVDIIFYSASRERELINKIKSNIELIDGITVANKDNFIDKAFKVINKHFQKLMSITNMRGALANISSDNDYVINSYIIENFNKTTSDTKQKILDMYLCEQQKESNEIGVSISKYKEKGINNINTFMKEMMPLFLKYNIFKLIATDLRDEDATLFNVEEYFDTIVKARNKLAHKKIEICRQGTFLKYFDNVKQYNERKCPSSCNEHNDEYKISCEEWKQIINKAKLFSEIIDKVQNKIEETQQN